MIKHNNRYKRHLIIWSVIHFKIRKKNFEIFIPPGKLGIMFQNVCK